MTTSETTYREAIRSALRDAMAADPRVFLPDVVYCGAGTTTSMLRIRSVDLAAVTAPERERGGAGRLADGAAQSIARALEVGLGERHDPRALHPRGGRRPSSRGEVAVLRWAA